MIKNYRSLGAIDFTDGILNFLSYLKCLVTGATNKVFEMGNPSPTNKLEIIICISQHDKSKLFFFFNNRRFITLFAVDYKIVTDSIEEQIKTFLKKSSVIRNNQTCLVKGRLIGNNVSLVYDIMNYSESKQIPGLSILGVLRKI